MDQDIATLDIDTVPQAVIATVQTGLVDGVADDLKSRMRYPLLVSLSGVDPVFSNPGYVTVRDDDVRCRTLGAQFDSISADISDGDVFEGDIIDVPKQRTVSIDILDHDVAHQRVIPFTAGQAQGAVVGDVLDNIVVLRHCSSLSFRDMASAILLVSSKNKPETVGNKILAAQAQDSFTDEMRPGTLSP